MIFFKKSQSFEILFSILFPFRFVSLVEIDLRKISTENTELQIVRSFMCMVEVVYFISS